MAEEEQPSDHSERPQEEGSITKEVTSLPFLRSNEFMETYANYVSFATSPWDMTIMFGRAVADNPTKPYIEQRLAVTVSPQTAKAMAEILVRNVQAYEQQYGEIRYTPIQQSSEEPSA